MNGSFCLYIVSAAECQGPVSNKGLTRGARAEPGRRKARPARVVSRETWIDERMLCTWESCYGDEMKLGRSVEGVISTKRFK
jgi:hypothetical protein